MCKELFELLLQFGNIIRSKNGGYYSENYTAVWKRMDLIHNSHFGLSKKNTDGFDRINKAAFQP